MYIVQYKINNYVLVIKFSTKIELKYNNSNGTKIRIYDLIMNNYKSMPYGGKA